MSAERETAFEPTAAAIAPSDKAAAISHRKLVRTMAALIVAGFVNIGIIVILGLWLCGLAIRANQAPALVVIYGSPPVVSVPSATQQEASAPPRKQNSL